jgi:threonine dehydratase
MHTPLLPDILPSLASVRDAAAALAPVFPPTPLRHSAALSALVGTPVLLKLEVAQETGSFKVRGAYTVLHRMAPEARARGVVASSAGNHGLGVAWAAHHFSAPATLYVPRDAPQVKKDGIAALGTTVNDEADDYDHAMVLAKAHAARAGIPFINPCLGVDLLAGQGTVALEILAQAPSARTVLVCVGGGGLLGGVGAVLRREAPTIRIVGAQSERTAAMSRSLAAGQLVEIASEPTLADGLAGQIDLDALQIGQQCLDDIHALDEDAIAQAIAWLHVHEGLQVEGAGAVTVAALLEMARAGRSPGEGPVVAIVSGRNIDRSRHRALLDRWLPTV